MQLGASLPVGDLGVDPIAIRDYAQAAEGLGYDYLLAPDHVLGANPATYTGDARIGTSASRRISIRSCCSDSWPAARAGSGSPRAC